MTASEFAFLAMGLILGLAAGAALVEVVRARPPTAREVRITMSTDAVPRRSSTLAGQGHLPSPTEPARGGPADRRDSEAMVPAGTAERRTAVLSGPGPTEGVGEGPMPGRIMRPAFPLRDPAPAVATSIPMGIPISDGLDPFLGELRASATVAVSAPPRATTATASTAVLESGGPSSPVRATKEPAPRVAGPGPASSRPGASSPAQPPSEASSQVEPDVAGHAVADGPCADLRRVAEERCELATRARAQAGTAEQTLRTAQRAYDEHEARGAAAQAGADPRSIRAAKDAAQERFRQGRSAAVTTDAVEAAARTWLQDVNAINAEAREATAALTRERAASQDLALDLERRSMETDAARMSAETAEAACLEAREALATCDEAGVDGGAIPSLSSPAHAPGSPFGSSETDPDSDQLAAALASGNGTPRIFRLLRGDRAAMGEMVVAMAGDDADDRRRWQLALAGLLDAIIADAIEGAALVFPPEHGFWGPFTVEQDRDIVRAMASLGYRFDGLGGWLDDRFPSQRDLSLALGYAGLDPMRMRQWPNDAEMADLFADVTVAADEHLAGAAGDLTLGELVSMLGRRADGLAELWNHWGRIRPLLLAES